jgi:glucose/arabinose dehydrogenase
VYRARVGRWIIRFFSIVGFFTLLAAGGFYVYRESELREKVLRKAERRVGPRIDEVLFFPYFDPQDEVTPRIHVTLTPVARGLTLPTDIQFLPTPQNDMVVLEQVGRVTRVDVQTGARSRWLDIEVIQEGEEQGLLGIAFHPRFGETGRMFVNYTAREAGDTYSFVSEYRVPNPKKALEETPSLVKHLLRVRQPFVNHNGGGMQFGPDGMLYVGFGDGGSGGDPAGHGQNGKTLLGSILRLDVDSLTGGDAGAAQALYAIPKDNPFIGREDVVPEAFVIGVRNPWRFSFDPKGRMVVADVGQNLWEEVGFAMAGDNLGWNLLEGRVCYRSPDCDTKGMRMPLLVYGRDEGQSITGGYVSLAPEPAALRGLYVYGDYVSGKLWALALPLDENAQAEPRPAELGTWPMHPSTFGRDATGRLYVADHKRGVIYRFDPKSPG